MVKIDLNELAIEIDALVDRRWAYKNDPPIDHWADYSEFFTLDFNTALQKNAWAKNHVHKRGNFFVIRDDCDAKSMTTLSLMARRGAPLENLILAAVCADEDQIYGGLKVPNHAVGLVYLGNNNFRIVGDTFAKSYMINEAPFKIPHTFMMYAQFTKPQNLLAWPPQFR